MSSNNDDVLQCTLIIGIGEDTMRTAINNCLKNWYEPWKKSFLEGGREFDIVYNLMDGLLHYEDQITNSQSVLSSDRLNAIAQAVARLIDYGNAILNIDLIIRNGDETSSELDPANVTTIGLFQAHTKAHKLREKLLYDYFKKDKPSLIGDDSPIVNCSLANLQVGSTFNGQPMHLSPNLDKPHRSLIGSNTSINTVSDGRRTPQPPLASQIEVKLSHNDLSNDLGQLEITHMTATIRSKVFSASSSSATRLTLLPGIIAKIESLLSLPTNTEKLTNCFELLDALLDSVERLHPDIRDKEVHMITTALLKPIVRKVYIDDRDSVVEFQHSHWTTCLLSMIRLMKANDFNTYLKHFNNMADLGAFIKDYLFIIKRIISSASDRQSASTSNEFDASDNSGPTYPHCWIEMNLTASSIFLTSLTYLYQVLRKYFASNIQMWMNFMDCLISFILQDALKSNRQMLKDRQRLFADDLRQTSAEYVWISWDSITVNQKQQILEDLIEPLLRACMSLNSRQRSILLPIFYDMMRCDYTSQYITPRGSLCGTGSSTLQGQKDISIDYTMYEDDLESLPPTNLSKSPNNFSKTNESLPYLSFRSNKSEDGTVLTKFTHLIVGKLNTLMIDLELGDKHFKDEICAAISGELNPKYYNRDSQLSSRDSDQFKSMARHTSDLIAEFMQICLDSRQANLSNYKHLYLLCLFRLILFFRDKVDQIELYLSNLYRLCYLHHAAGRFVEAGYTLLEHAKTLPWSDVQLENHYRIITRFFQTPNQLTDFMSLKIFLYSTIMEYFDKGQLWEAAVPLCRELIDIYEFKTFEYNKLAYVLQRTASYFKHIVETGSRSYPEYFRVSFYGKGFPVCLRDSTVVYRGRAYEKLGDFQTTMLNKYPDAKLLNSLARPDDALLGDPEARYLQVNACTPTVELKTKFGPDSPKIEESILNYYRHNECDKFNFSRRISKPITSAAAAAAQHGFNSDKTLHTSLDDSFANMWRERTTLTTNTLPGMLPFFPVYLIETSIVSPIESAIEDLTRTNDRLSCMVNRFKADKRQVEDIRLLGQLLLGIVDAAVNGGITKYEEAFFDNPVSGDHGGGGGGSRNQHHHHHNDHGDDMRKTLDNSTGGGNNVTTSSPLANLESNFDGLYVTLDQAGRLPKQQTNTAGQNLIDQQRPSPGGAITNNTANLMVNIDDGTPNTAQVDRLKSLIAQQVPLLDEAIQLHKDRVADVMRPQHEHLELSYKKLKHHVMSKYSRYLPSDYSRSTMRSFRSLARSPNRSIRSDSRLPLMSGSGRFSVKRMSDAGPKQPTVDLATSFQSNGGAGASQETSNIPYKQFGSERRSLPFLTGLQSAEDHHHHHHHRADDDVHDKEVVVGQSTNSSRRLPSPPSTSNQPQTSMPGLPLIIGPDDHQLGEAPIPAARGFSMGQASESAASRIHTHQNNDAYLESPNIRIQFKQSYTRLMGNSIERQVKLLDDSESRESLEYDEDEDEDVDEEKEDNDSEKCKFSANTEEVNLVSL